MSQGGGGFSAFFTPGCFDGFGAGLLLNVVSGLVDVVVVVDLLPQGRFGVAVPFRLAGRLIV